MVDVRGVGWGCSNYKQVVIKRDVVLVIDLHHGREKFEAKKKRFRWRLGGLSFRGEAVLTR
jgi:hypothetical protein